MNEQINNGGQGQQAARVDEEAVSKVWQAIADHPDNPIPPSAASVRAALEAALPQPLIHESRAMSSESGQPAERQGDRPAGMNDILWANRGGVPAHPAAPVGVPDENWLADQLCALRNKWAEDCEPGWLETDDNHPDDWMAKELRKRWLAAAPSASEVQA